MPLIMLLFFKQLENIFSGVVFGFDTVVVHFWYKQNFVQKMEFQITFRFAEKFLFLRCISQSCATVKFFFFSRPKSFAMVSFTSNMSWLTSPSVNFSRRLFDWSFMTCCFKFFRNIFLEGKPFRIEISFAPLNVPVLRNAKDSFLFVFKFFGHCFFHLEGQIF